MKTRYILLTAISLGLACLPLLPATQAAPSPSNVNVVNTPNVNVVNATTDPVLVRDVDNPAGQPFQAQVVGGFADGASTTGDITITTVPAGKRLIIEHVWAFAKMLRGQKVIYGDLTPDRPGTTRYKAAFHWFTQGTNADGTLDYFVASDPVRFYVQPGPINCSAERDSFAGANPDSVTFTISGYFVDCPICVQ